MPSPPNDHYALVGNRLGFRLGYVPDELRADRETHGIFRLDDQPVKVRVGSTTIRDVINDTPNTCALTIDAATPPSAGQRLTVRINSNKPRTLFAGPLQTVGLSYELLPHQTVYPCQAIDDTPVANRKLPYGAWVNTSASQVGTWLVATFCPAGFSAAGVQPNLPPITVNFDGTEGMDGCLRQVAKLIGGYFYWDDKTLHLFIEEPGDAPDPIDDVHPFLDNPAIALAVDTSQVRTRVYGKGYAEEVIADVAANDPIVPISNAVMFNPAGGQAVTETQRLKYTGTTPGGGGTVVGPGVGPAAAPQASIAQGAGVTPGAHDYAVSFVTAAGESLLGPRASINVSGFMAPPAAPAAAPPSGGGPGPEAGVHQYASTFTNAAGESLPSPVLAVTAPTVAAPAAPVQYIIDSDTGSGFSGIPGMAVGGTLVIYYTYSADPTDRLAPFPADGETSFSPPSAGYVLKQCPGRPAGSIMNFAFAVPFSPDPNVKWIHLWFSMNFQPMFYVAVMMLGHNNIQNQISTAFSVQAYQCGFYTSQLQPSVFNPILGGVGVYPAIGPAGTTGRKIYRTAAGASQLKFVGTIPDNTTAALWDNIRDAALGANAPTVATAVAAQVALAGIPIGAATVTGRKIYRTPAGASQLKLLATLADNATTAYLDALADASLGAVAPTGDTSGLKQPDGMVLAGASSMIAAGVAWASPLGGWAVIGNGQQTIRYAALAGNTLTGIPAAGPGAITATVSYNSTITAAAALLGVTGLLRALIKGAPINIWVQRDDLAAQASITALDGTDGIVEHLITDERRGEASLIQLCDADLAQYAQPIRTIPYGTRDTKTKSGKPIVFSLATPAIHETLTIQDVTITEIDVYPRTPPKFTATASSVRFSLEDILRRLGASLDVTS